MRNIILRHLVKRVACGIGKMFRFNRKKMFSRDFRRASYFDTIQFSVMRALTICACDIRLKYIYFYNKKMKNWAYFRLFYRWIVKFQRSMKIVSIVTSTLLNIICRITEVSCFLDNFFKVKSNFDTNNLQIFIKH